MVRQSMDDTALRGSHGRREDQSFALVIIFEQQKLRVITKRGWIIQVYFYTVFSVIRV